MQARDCGDYANRNHAAHEVSDDETPSSRPREEPLRRFPPIGSSPRETKDEGRETRKSSVPTAEYFAAPIPRRGNPKGEPAGSLFGRRGGIPKGTASE